MKEQEMDRLTRAVQNAHNKYVKPGEVSPLSFITNPYWLKDGRMYLCLCDMNGEPFYQILPCIAGTLPVLANTYTITSFALLP